MATEPQRHALAKWLGQEVKNMDFEAASELLQRLHGASELYNKDPKKHKGIVKKEKETILSVLRDKGLLYEEGEQEEEEEQELKDFGDSLKEGMGGHINTFTGRTLATEAPPATPDREEEIIQRVAGNLKACLPYAAGIVESELSQYGVSNEQKAELIEKLSVSIYIQASREGL